MVDAWSSTPPSAQEFPHSPTNGFDALLDRMAKLEQRISAIPNNLLSSAGLSVSPDGLTIDSELLVTGATRIEGTLSLPEGIIDNDALANPVTMQSGYAIVTGMDFLNALTIYATADIVVPEGFNSMAFSALGSVEAYNNTVGSTQYLLARVRRSVNGGPFSTAGDQARATVPDGYRATVNPNYMFSVAVTPGDVHTFGIEAWVGAGTWAADAGNYARVSVQALFTR